MSSRTLAHLHGRSLAQLLRLPLALMVALTAMVGALVAPVAFDGLTLWAIGSGIFLLTAAGSVLNQVQERTTDALLRRTAGRPLACGLLTPAAGTALGLLLASGGLAVLATGTGPVPALLGLAALAWYLLVYTPLKRLTPLAVLAGTPCGALPPLMGWLAAGGTLPAPQPLALALVMLLWQVPHYWLLALPDRDELKNAGFRVLPLLSDRQLLTVSHRWILGLALSTLLLPALDLPGNPLAQGVLIGLAAALAITATWAVCRGPFPAATARRLRRDLHIFLGIALLALVTDHLLPLVH
jgi:protoheme IX farnesyltransferase